MSIDFIAYFCQKIPIIIACIKITLENDMHSVAENLFFRFNFSYVIF